MLGDHVDEVVAELGEVGGLPVVVPTVDDGRVERALESYVRRGPDEVEEESGMRGAGGAPAHLPSAARRSRYRPSSPGASAGPRG